MPRTTSFAQGRNINTFTTFKELTSYKLPIYDHPHSRLSHATNPKTKWEIESV